MYLVTWEAERNWPDSEGNLSYEIVTNNKFFKHGWAALQFYFFLRGLPTYMNVKMFRVQQKFGKKERVSS